MIQTCRNQLRMDKTALSKCSHAGLLLSLYLQNDSKEARDTLLDCTCRAPKASKQMYQNAFDLFKQCLPHNSVSALVSVDGRAVIGLGVESPLETGLTLHHTYGVPYIPGSALKGLASHYCAQVWGEHNGEFKCAGKYHELLFGTTEGSGYIVFNDGLITPNSLHESIEGNATLRPVSCLEIDVMAVHHPNYYKADNDPPPSDFDDPNPIKFLSIQGSFFLSVFCDTLGNSGKAWANLSMELILEALGNWGIGAKTSSGYGRMKRS